MYEQPSPPQQPPFETPYIPYTPPTPPKNERKGLKRAGIILLIFVTLAAVGVSAYAMVRNAELKNELANVKNNSQTASDENKEGELPGGMITETLPNGQTMTYEDNEATRNILWWSNEPGAADTTIVLSHKAYQRFLATIGVYTIENVCGADDDLLAAKYNIIAGILVLDTKEITQPEIENCVALLATDANTDEGSRAKAQETLKQVEADVATFVESVTIE